MQCPRIMGLRRRRREDLRRLIREGTCATAEWRTIELPVSVALGELGRVLTLLRGVGELTKVMAENWRDLGQDQREEHEELSSNIPLGCPTSTSIGKPVIH